MNFLLFFAITLFVAVLISGLARRSILSTAVLFLVAGFAASPWMFNEGRAAQTHLLDMMAQFALFSVLFTDGMRTGGLHELQTSFRVPGRMLFIGMPLTLGGIGLLAHFLVKMSWIYSFLIAAVLSPTDPVFVAAIFLFDEIPRRVKYLLNVESGLNDGLALPVIMLLLPFTGGHHESISKIVGELLFGVGIGVVIPWIGIVLERSRFFEAVGPFQPLNAFALGLLVLGVALASGANLFLAAFAAGVSVATFSQAVRNAFQQFGELITELLKLAALLTFGALIAPRLFVPIPAREYIFVLLAVFVMRIPAVWISLLGTGLGNRDKLAVGWFGPKGFASVVYGIMIFNLGSPPAQHAAHLVALAVTASIIVYSSTDILVGRWFQRRARAAEADSPEQP